MKVTNVKHLWICETDDQVDYFTTRNEARDAKRTATRNGDAATLYQVEVQLKNRRQIR